MTGPSDGDDTGVTPSLHAVAAAMFYIMALFGCVAAGYEMLYLARSGTLDGIIGISLAIIMISLGIVVIIRRLTERIFIRVFELAIFYLESPLLLIGVAYNLFFAPSPSPALHYAVWIFVTFICAVATRPPRWAQTFGWLLYGGEVTVFAAWLALRGIDPTIEPFAASFVELMLCQAASLALLHVLSAYRERDAFNRARIATLEETSEAMERAARDAREAQRRTEIALGRADQAMRARDRFFATVSHELRTPLNAIIGFSDILARELYGRHAEPRYREYAADIKESGDHLLGVINHLLDFARLEAGEVPMRVTRIDLADIAGTVMRLLAINAERAGVDLRFENRPDGSCWILADEQAVRQIVMNILSNAIKFTNAGGSVSIGVGLADSGAAVLAVTDTGIGIPASKLSDIFEPFRRVENDATVAIPGTGLGLAIVRSLVAALGGEVAVASELGRGSIFTVTLPSAPGEIARDSAVA
jgi:signal transduction histidine kinase